MATCYNSITFATLLLSVIFMNLRAVSCLNEEDASHVTLGSIGKKKLENVYKVIGQEKNVKEALKTFDLMSSPWSGFDSAVQWENNLTDDRSPFEYSITFKGNATTPVIRFLIEPQDFPLTKQSNWTAGLALKERLMKLPSVDTSRLDKIQNIFLPPTSQEINSHFTIWYAAVLEPNNPQIKVYLNPQIQGEEKAPTLVKNAFKALDSEHAWKFIENRIASSKNPSKMLYFSLDLSATQKARTKLYITNESLEDIEAHLKECLYYEPGAASKWVKTLTNQVSFDKKPVLTTYNFTSEHDLPVPTVHTPIRSYAENDEKAVERLNAFLSLEQIKKLKAIITQISGASLKDAQALTYVSLRPSSDGQLDVTCYIAPCIYSNSKQANKGIEDVSAKPFTDF